MGLRFRSRSPEGVEFLPGVMAASAVVRGVTDTEGLGLHFCAGFLSPPVDVPCLESRLGLEGLVLHY